MVPPERPELSASADDAGMRSTPTRQAVVRVLRITGGLQREESIGPSLHRHPVGVRRLSSLRPAGIQRSPLVCVVPQSDVP